MMLIGGSCHDVDVQGGRAAARRVGAVLLVLLSMVLAGSLPAGAVTPPAGTSRGSAVAASPSATGSTAAGAFVPLSPVRLMDTRPGRLTVDGVAAGAGAVSSTAPRVLPVAGRGGVPATGVAAVVLNVTGVAPSSATVMTIFPAGEVAPSASNLNLRAGQTVANLAVVKLGSSGAVTVRNSTGASHVVVDVSGYYPVGPSYTALSPARLLDTRPGRQTVDGQYAGLGPLGAGGNPLDLPVAGRNGIPSTGVAAVVLNLTGVTPTAPTYLTAYPAGEKAPVASSLNLAAGAVTANLVVVGVGAGGKVSLSNALGATHIVVDVAGWIPSGTSYTPVVPARFLDTRQRTTVDGFGVGSGPVGAGSSVDVRVIGRGGLPSGGIPLTASAVVVNVTAVAPTVDTYVSAYPTGPTRPTSSTLNAAAGEIRAGLAIVKLGPAGTFTLSNAGGQTDLVADVVGWYDGAPAPVPTWTALAGGDHQTCGLRTDRSAWCWGRNLRGSLGDGTTLPSAVPVRVGTGTWVSISTGATHTCGVRTDATAWCWGANQVGQLGHGTTTDSAVPVQVGSDANWASVVVASDSTCGLRTDRTAWCWGFNDSGQLGDGTLTNRASPVAVGTATWVGLAVGGSHTCGVRVNGTAWCWGSNASGVLGHGPAGNSSVPLRVSGGGLWTSLTAGPDHTCGVQSDRSAWCWGSNRWWALGIGAVGDTAVPVRIIETEPWSTGPWSTVSAGKYHTCALNQTGIASCWGYGYAGQLGGSEITTPVPRLGGGSLGFTTLTAGDQHTCGIRSDQTAWCWGADDFGQLGHGPTVILDDVPRRVA